MGVSSPVNTDTIYDLDADVATLSNVTIADTIASDEVLVNDGGTMKVMAIQDAGVRVVNLATTQTFALGDANTLQTLTGGDDRAWTVPTNAAVAFPIGTEIGLASRDAGKVTIDNAGVTVTTKDGDGLQTVTAGALAVLVKIASDEWMLSGNLEA